jgi:hypothetical protein
VTAPTRFVTANGIRYAYRRFGAETGTPLVFLQHFRGGMDHWDPAVTDGLAANRPVILFDNTGVASSSGQTPDTVEAQADDAAALSASTRPGKGAVLSRRPAPLEKSSPQVSWMRSARWDHVLRDRVLAVQGAPEAADGSIGAPATRDGEGGGTAGAAARERCPASPVGRTGPL